MALPAPAADGFYHPTTEAELVALVKAAYADGVPLRVRGSVHSISYGIYTNPAPGTPNTMSDEGPPPPGGVNVMLDRYAQIVELDAATGRVTVQAGIHLGYDPQLPGSTLEQGLLYQMQQKGWTLSDLGGITHQTVSGFLCTGSSGGSTTYGIEENIVGFRIIDGRGEIYEVDRTDADPSAFAAATVSLGLLGVLSTVKLQGVPTFNIVGTETITTIAEGPIDLFGEDPPGATRPTLQKWLADTGYGRLFWWPQAEVERVVVWQAERAAPTAGFTPQPYREFGEVPLAEELLIAIFYTIIGNLDDLTVVPAKLDPIWDAARKIAAEQAQGQAPLAEDGVQGVLKGIEVVLKDVPEVGHKVSVLVDGAEDFGIDALEKLVDALVAILVPFEKLLKLLLPVYMPKLIDLFVPLDSEPLDKPQRFQDYAWTGLPMDNQADDTLIGTGFTEIWVPIGYTTQVMRLFRDYFAVNKPGWLDRTGTYTWELYAAKANSAWMSPAYSDGTDEWKDGVFRVDVFWYRTFAGSPIPFYQQFWDLLHSAGIPFRLHWGKYQPQGNVAKWAPWFRAQYPQWDAFLALRAEKDPKNLFLTDYWRERLGLS